MGKKRERHRVLSKLERKGTQVEINIAQQQERKQAQADIPKAMASSALQAVVISLGRSCSTGTHNILRHRYSKHDTEFRSFILNYTAEF